MWGGLVGQHAAVAVLTRAAADPVHAYLFAGPAGTGKERAARAFAALLLDPTGDPSSRVSRLALAGQHPDVREVHRAGASITVDQASDVIRTSALAPTEGNRKVLILHEFHLLAPAAAAMLLKTIEEPPASTVFIVLADQVTPELVTIASRCVRIGFSPLSDDDIAEALIAEGIEADAAHRAAVASGGNLDRARLLAADAGLATRRGFFAGIARRLDGTGQTVLTLVDELNALMDQAVAPLTDRHALELAALEARIAQTGERGSGRKQLDEQHRRELRRHKTDELRAGLAVLAGSYRDALVGGGNVDATLGAVTAIHATLESLERNPNEALQLQALLLQLPTLH